ncbi:hypothetical protein E1B28_002987 [Marasmius oreades]|uniref:Uncharacterized protein n=1 Tax=Marasmius oreades TaxID=181124 RepID=A0A9P7ULQ9_9AGAR|nr:uncharacterized protein E1B28_002987 [Marasmius oreades]KAG7085426.1 hypothetical protein E1B28_002987 [Marasmius oreades]
MDSFSVGLDISLLVSLLSRSGRGCHSGPWFAGNIKDETTVKNYGRTVYRGGSSIYEEIRKAGLGYTNHTRCYHLRAYDGKCSLIVQPRARQSRRPVEDFSPASLVSPLDLA